MRLWLALFLALLFLAGPAAAKPLVADLSQYRIDIDSNFNGTRLLLFGARNDTGDIVVVVRGPERQFTVRRKERVAGLWLNRRERRFSDVPTYYVIASSKPLSELHYPELFKKLRIGLKEAAMVGGAGDPIFAEALIEHQQIERLYTFAPQTVSFMGESLFKLAIPFPDNIPGGNYTADVYLLNDGEVVSMQSIPLHVEQIGFDAWVYSIAHEHSVLYGFIAVLVAVSIGWGVSSLMRRYSA